MDVRSVTRSEMVTSSDGTTIGFRTVGRGPSVVVVHGSIDTGHSWMRVAEGLADAFTSHLVDRRGRGLSGDAEEYSLDLEAADIASVIDSVGPVTGLVGHSYGAICVMQALLAGAKVDRAVLYEPPLPVYGPVAGAGLDRFSELLVEGDTDEALAYALVTFAGAATTVVQALRASPGWPELVSLTPTWERELRAIDAVGPGVSRFADLTTPTTLLVGELTSAAQRSRVDALDEVMPAAGVTPLPGQGQGPPAHRSAPDMLVDVLRETLTQPVPLP